MNKLTVTILGVFVFIGGYAQKPVATINKTWAVHNVMKNGKKGMDIHVSFNVNNMKDHKINVVAQFYDSNKNSLKNPNANAIYKSANNTLWTYLGDTPKYENTKWDDFCIFMPYDQFPGGNGTTIFYYTIFVNGIEKGWLPGNSGYTQFTISWPQQNSNSVNQNQTSNQRFISYDCPHCGKTGKCRQCNGTGRNLLALRNGIFSPCASCWGTLKCSACGGTGTWVVDNYSSSSVSTGNYGSGYSSGSTINYGGGSNSSGSNSGKYKCGICNGTGNCDQCAGRGERRLGGDGEKVDCWRCHGTGKCQVCYGDGYKYR